MTWAALSQNEGSATPGFGRQIEIHSGIVVGLEAHDQRFPGGSHEVAFHEQIHEVGLVGRVVKAHGLAHVLVLEEVDRSGLSLAVHDIEHGDLVIIHEQGHESHALGAPVHEIDIAGQT